jgi:outer membrane protein TolC
VDSARAATRVTGYELADLQRQTVFQVKRSFTDILMARDTLALAEENLKTLDELERVQRFREEKGDISQLDCCAFRCSALPSNGTPWTHGRP